MNPARMSCRAACIWLLAAATAMAQPAPPKFVVETVAGNGAGGAFPADGGSALDVSIDQPFGVEFAPEGGLVVCSVGQHRVLFTDLDDAGTSSAIGNGTKGYSGDGGPGRNAQLNEPYEIRFDDAGNLFIVEMQNHVVRRVDAQSGTVSTVAGTGTAGYSGDDGPATRAQLRQPHSIALDDRGQLYIADIGNHRIRRVDLASGTITSIAGNGQRALPRDGETTQGHPILGPRALFVTGRTLWVALREGNSVWRIDLDTLVARHVAGTGEKGFTGDGGSAKTATFNGPKGIAATPEGLVYVVDTENQAIRLIDTAADRIDTIAGSGPEGRGFAGENTSALQAKFDRPHGIDIGPDGAIYIGDTNNHRVRRLRPAE